MTSLQWQSWVRGGEGYGLASQHVSQFTKGWGGGGVSASGRQTTRDCLQGIGQTPPPPPPRHMETVNKRAVRILLEWFLDFYFHAVSGKKLCQIIRWRTSLWEILDPPLVFQMAILHVTDCYHIHFIFFICPHPTYSCPASVQCRDRVAFSFCYKNVHSVVSRRRSYIYRLDSRINYFPLVSPVSLVHT